MITIAVANQKGGVGKTTTAVNLGACLAHSGRSVLAVDLDHQCNLTEGLGAAADGREPDLTAFGLMMGRSTLDQATIPVAPNYALVPAHIHLAELDMEMSREFVMNRESQLQHALADAPYDYVLIDTPPSLGMATINALVAADVVIIAVQTYTWAYDAIKRLMLLLNRVKAQSNPALVFYALPTLHRTNVNIQKDTLDEVRALFKELTLPTIRHTAAFAEAVAMRQTIVDYAHGSRGHQDYQKVTEEIIRRVERTDSAEAREA